MTEAQLTWAILAVVVAAVVPIVILARCYGKTEQSVKTLHDALFDNDGDNKLDAMRISVEVIERRLQNGYFGKVDRLCSDVEGLKHDVSGIKERVNALEKR